MIRRGAGNSLRWPGCGLTLCALVLPAQAADPGDPFAPLARETRPLSTRWQTDYRGAVELGAAYTSDDNFTFGQYNGLDEQGVNLIGNLQWRDYGNADSTWDIQLTDLGLPTREGRVTWGLGQRLKLELELDSQRQVRNDSGATPFRGTTALTLPGDWQSALQTSGFQNLQSSLRTLNRELERDRYRLALEGRLNEAWMLYGSWLYEEKQGTGDIGAGIYIDGASADATLLPYPVDYRNQEGELGLRFAGNALQLDAMLQYSGFDNQDSLLSWQNPYSSFSPAVRYPQGYGGLALAPDNEQWSGRLSGTWLLAPTLRLSFDGYHALATQDEALLDYSVNSALNVTQPLPTASLDGEVASSVVNGKLWWRPLSGLEVEGWFRARERDYDVDRNRYLYIRGDGGSQPRDALAVYNTAHDYLSQQIGGELRYRLSSRHRFGLEYEYEEIDRRNAAVETTEEDRLTASYRIRLAAGLQGRLELSWADRAASTYYWDQSYYALLDAGLINATPDNQRFNNHPELSQFYLANREQLGARLGLNYSPIASWSFDLDLRWRDDDYDKTELGLTGADWQTLQLSASYHPAAALTATLYGGFDRYRADQRSRAFRGGQEKNAFAVTPPLPQSSDPTRNWSLAAQDDSLNLGASLQWQPAERLDLQLAYSFVDTRARQRMSAAGAADLNPADLPDVDTQLQQLDATGQWHLRDDLTLALNYQYYRYDTNDWAWRNVEVDTLDKVLGSGQRNPNDSIHYLGASVIYRWQ
ncbi:MtrB/PioB family decaheme-associated outer membrane protein [Parahaliea maris]|uniref:MtrB/PioB family decaheme-associated outer membrane protein n=1 Tax=Parahaliea maris TaxID=2716870 RepID=UPI00164F7A61|nr:MtrB/PioB family decaheme-associated outer membrane protein [Parahaliea maris]